MSNLSTLIKSWKTEQENNKQEFSFRTLFSNVLHKEPYHLRYSLDKKRPKLFMIHPTELSQNDNKVVQECNGIILDGETFEIVSYGMQNLTDSTVHFDSTKTDFDNENIHVEEAEDGTVLRVFYWNNEWIVSTNRRIDASRVRWASNKTFYELLSEAVPDRKLEDLFEKDLSKENTYSFILLHPENQLVIDHSEPRLVLIGYRNNSTFVEKDHRDLQLDWAQNPHSITENTLKFVNDHLESKERFDKRGLIISDWSVSTVVKRVKIDYQWFTIANDLRKNMPTLHLSYLACSFQEKKLMRSYFGQLDIFNMVDSLLRYLTKYSFETYRDSYVRKQYKVPTDHPIFYVVRRLHYLYKTGGEPIKMQHVRTILDSTPAHILDSMLFFFSTHGFYPPVPTVHANVSDKVPGENNIDKLIEEDVRSDVATTGSARIDDDVSIVASDDVENK